MSNYDALASARSATAVLAEQADYGEEHGRLSDVSIEGLKDSGMLSLWRPVSLGGHECADRGYRDGGPGVVRVDVQAPSQPRLSDQVPCPECAPIEPRKWAKLLDSVATPNSMDPSSPTSPENAIPQPPSLTRRPETTFSWR